MARTLSARNAIALCMALGVLSCRPRVHTVRSPEVEPPPPALVPVPADVVAEKLFRYVIARDYAGVVSLLTPAMAKMFNEEKQRAFFEKQQSTLGAYTSVSREFRDPHHGIYRFTGERGASKVILDVTPEGKIAALQFRPPPPPDPPVAKSTIELGLPVRGKWFVDWGGSTIEENKHLASHDQRRAVDLVVYNEKERSFAGSGDNNTDYFAYGKEIYSVADGEVFEVIDGVHENEPEKMNSYSTSGNQIILKHTDTLYSVYNHLQPGKHRVKVGDKVKRGQVIALCGNSGNSSEPHLHFQLQDGPKMEDAWGVEAVFKNVSIIRYGKSMTLPEYALKHWDYVLAP